MCFKKDFRLDEVPIIRGNDIFFHEGFMIKNDQLRKGDESK